MKIILLFVIVTTLITTSGCIAPADGQHANYRSHLRLESSGGETAEPPLVFDRPPEVIVP
jgi:hypothetical protein